MKKTLIGQLIGAVLVISGANAATTITGASYSLAAGTDGFATQVVVGPALTPYTAGTVMYGTFSTTAGLGTAAGGANFLSNFGWTLFASTPFNTSVNQPGLFGATGATGTLPTSGSSALVGNDIYAVVANAAGTEFIIWNSGQKFAYEVEGVGGAAVGFQTRNVALIRGTLVPGGNNGLGGALNTNGRNDEAAVTFIPEPSVALLGLLGVLGFLKRRR